MTELDELHLALKYAAATRSAWKGHPRSEAKTAALKTALGLLSAITPPPNRPITGRRTSPEGLVWRERRAEMQRLRSALAPTSGTPTVRLPHPTDSDFSQSITRTTEKLEDLFAERLTLAKHFREVDNPVRLNELVDEATRLKAELRAIRLAHATVWRRWPNEHFNRELVRRQNELTAKMTRMRRALDRLSPG